MAHLLDWFWALDARRTGTGYGPNPITWPDIQAWSAMTGILPDAWEADALAAMDNVRLRHFADSRAKKDEPDLAPEPLSPEQFAALYGGRK